MKTVSQVSRLTGVSVRTLHYYDTLGLLKPAQVTEAGYRLYGDRELERLYLILVFRELGLSLGEIRKTLDAPDDHRNRILDQQIRLMEEKITRLQDRITLARGIRLLGVKYMDFNGFNPKKMDEYSAQAKALYGKTDAYREFEKKSAGRSAAQEKNLGDQVMGFFVRLGQLRPCAPDCEAAQIWAKELQEFFTEHYYRCTPQIFRCLAESYAGGGSMTENIDKAGGAGTGVFAKEVIDAYLDSKL